MPGPRLGVSPAETVRISHKSAPWRCTPSRGIRAWVAAFPLTGMRFCRTGEEYYAEEEADADVLEKPQFGDLEEELARVLHSEGTGFDSEKRRRQKDKGSSDDEDEASGSDEGGEESGESDDEDERGPRQRC